MRKAARRDDNHNELVGVFRALGCTVFETDRVGEGFPDVVVGCIGVNHLVEIKNPGTDYGRAGLNQKQKLFNDPWRGEKVVAVWTQDEVTALVANWRKKPRES